MRHLQHKVINRVILRRHLISQRSLKEFFFLFFRVVLTVEDDVLAGKVEKAEGRPTFLRYVTSTCAEA